MSTAPQTVSAAQARSKRRSFMEFVTSPAVARIVAAIAVTPFAFRLYFRVAAGILNIPAATGSIMSLALIRTMVFRRPPVRIVPNPWYWLLAFIATYGTLVPFAVASPGREIAPAALTTSLSLVGFAFALLARVILGRSTGFVPAQRVLVHAGAYSMFATPFTQDCFWRTWRTYCAHIPE
jgi:hypothetical protein